MFVDIESFKSVLAIENLLIPYKRGRLAPDKNSYLPKEPITPEVCWEVLKSTNAPRNIENMLQCIADLPLSEQAQFKDIVLATFDNREQPNTKPHNIVLLGRKLAQASGYEAEFVEAQKIKDGDFLLSSSEYGMGFVCSNNAFQNIDFSAYEKVICLSDAKIQFLEGVKFPKILEMPNSSDVSFVLSVYRDYSSYSVGSDFTGLQSMRFKEGAKVDLSKAQNLPKNLVLSTCSDVDLRECDFTGVLSILFKEGAKVDLREAQNLPSQLDFSMCSEVDLRECDFTGVKSIRFCDDAEVNLSKAQNLPSDIDVSMCADVKLLHCDLKEQPNLSFKDGARVNLYYAQNLPPQLDVSMCSDVSLIGCDLFQQKLRFRNDAKVDLREVINLSPEVDLSQCAEVKLSGESWNENAYLRFKDGARVMLQYFKKLPPNLDFSRCDMVDLSSCDLSNQPHLAFKDGAIVNLSKAYNLPSNLDFSQCDRVRLSGCDLSNQSNLAFKDGAIVNLSEAYNLPLNLDFSRCDNVDLEGCDLGSVQKLTFINREQMENSGAKLPDDWKGKLVFADEQPEIQTGKNIDASAQFTKSWRKFIGKVFGNDGR